MESTSQIKPSITFWVVAGMLASLAALVTFWPRTEELRAERLQQQLAALPEDQIADCLRGMAALGNPGIREIVASLDSKRPSVVTTAKTVLLAEVDSWELLPAGSSTPKLAELADALAERMGHWETQNRSFASNMALRILLWPPSNQTADRERMLATCERILHDAAQPKTAADSPDIIAADGESNSKSAVTERIVARAAMPGGGFRPQSMPMPDAEFGSTRSTTESTNPATESMRAAAPSELTTSKDLPFGGLQPPRRLPLNASAKPVRTDDAADREARPQDTAKASESPTAAKTSPDEKPTPVSYAPSGAMDEFALLEAMRRLQADNPAERTAAELELGRQGFGPTQIILAKQLTHPDQQARKQLAEALPQVEGIDARPWFLWLSRDADADVRLAAATMMATSGDSALLKRVEELARTDSDPRINV